MKYRYFLNIILLDFQQNSRTFSLNSQYILNTLPEHFVFIPCNTCIFFLFFANYLCILSKFQVNILLLIIILSNTTLYRFVGWLVLTWHHVGTNQLFHLDWYQHTKILVATCWYQHGTMLVSICLNYIKAGFNLIFILDL